SPGPIQTASSAPLSARSASASPWASNQRDDPCSFSPAREFSPVDSATIDGASHRGAHTTPEAQRPRPILVRVTGRDIYVKIYQMSKILDAMITCANCRHEFKTSLHSTLWLDNPNHIDLVLRDQLNVRICTLCKS